MMCSLQERVRSVSGESASPVVTKGDDSPLTANNRQHRRINKRVCEGAPGVPRSRDVARSVTGSAQFRKLNFSAAIASLSSSLSFFFFGSAFLSPLGGGSGFLSILGSGSGFLSIFGSGSGFLSILGNGSGFLSILGSGSGFLSDWGKGSGFLSIFGKGLRPSS